jgi:SAM-dependent methyltransferase
MFSTTYAKLYDSIHESKNYSKEVEQILGLINPGKTEKLRGFDLGCGTGLHAAEFARLGIEVDGFDVSKEMLAVARARHPFLKLSDDLDDFSRDYDFSYSLFDVLSYQTTVSDLRILLLTLFKQTKKGGVCLIDSWNSIAVRQDPPRYNERIVTSGLSQIWRKVTPDISLADQNIYRLSIDLVDSETGVNLKNEVHVLRAWSPKEVRDEMESIGFHNIIVFNPVNPEIAHTFSDWRFGVKANKP